jgi:bacterioferritin-associated ferredoxin
VDGLAGLLFSCLIRLIESKGGKMYVCVCKAITDSQILTAIEKGVCTRKQLMHCFGMGMDCGKCDKEVTDLLKRGNDLPVLKKSPHSITIG